MTEIKDDKDVSATPEGVVAPVTPPPTSQDTTKEIEALKAQWAEAQRKITELSTTNATLLNRVDEVENASYLRPTTPASGYVPEEPVVQPENQLDNVVKMAQSNPEIAFEQLGRMIEQSKNEAEKNAFARAQAEMQKTMYLYQTAEQAKGKIKDEKLSHWEREILQECDNKHQRLNMPYEKAIEKTIAEYKQKREIDIKNAQPPQPKVEAPLPSGAKVETDTNTPPPQPQPEVREETRTDYVNARQSKRIAKIYGLK